MRLALERGLRRLDPRPRAVFLLFEVEGFTHREVGEILGIPEGTSKHALFVAKKELQAQVLGLQRRRES
jgi:RNA polymerase sigma-70 factor (ECF subfamily)